MNGRRGISPLIATILLIAFAVALGSLVYSYIVIFQGGTGARGCSNIVSIDSAVKTDDGGLAYSIVDGEIIIDIRNSGYTEVTSLDITYVGSEENLDVDRERAALAVSRTKKFREAYDRTALGAIQTIIVTPYFVQAEEETICSEASIEIRELKR